MWSWSAPRRVEVRVAPLSEGFALPGERLAVLTEAEIFGPRERRRRRESWQESAALDGIASLTPGDHLVHADHGIGTYRGLVEIEGAGHMCPVTHAAVVNRHIADHLRRCERSGRDIPRVTSTGNGN